MELLIVVAQPQTTQQSVVVRGKKLDIKAALQKAEGTAMQSCLGFLPGEHPWCIVYKGERILEAIEAAVQQLQMLDSPVYGMTGFVAFWRSS